MRSAIVLVGKPKRERPCADKRVEPALASGMPVDCLVLQAGLPGDRPCRDRNESPDRQAVMEKTNPEPQPIDQSGKRQGRPLDRGPRKRNVLYLHRRSPEAAPKKSPRGFVCNREVIDWSINNSVPPHNHYLAALSATARLPQMRASRCLAVVRPASAEPARTS